MKIPLAYPKIPDSVNCPLKQCIAFEKLDGTNLHWIWEYDHWTRFGTRRSEFLLKRNGIVEFNSEHPQLVRAVDLFNDTIRDSLTAHFFSLEEYKSKKISVFTEFYGNESFAGQHSINDEYLNSQYLKVIDVAIIIPTNKGDVYNFIFPQKFAEEYNLFIFDIPKIVYKGKYTGQFAEDVRNGKYSVNEGVVCKGVVDNKVYMTKIKTNSYMEELKNRFHNNWKDYWE